MVTEVYLIRHAEAEGNLNETFQGRINTELTEKGEKQLKLLSERFKDINIDYIYSSPFKRAALTAEAVNKYHNRKINYDINLSEINGGVWEGKKWSEIPASYPIEYNLWKNKMHEFYIDKGETMRQVFNRITCTINKIAAKNSGKTIAVISHGCALRNFLSYAAGDGIEGLYKVGWSDNTSVSLVKYDNEGVKIIYKNNSDHLTSDTSTLINSKWCRYEDKKE